MEKLKVLGVAVVQKYPVLGSSVNPQQLSLTAQGVMTAVIPTVAWVLRLKGMDVDPSLLTQIGDAVLQVVQVMGSLVSALQILWGLLRKFVALIKK